ncbi:uncharacterized protein LOC123316650 [Coccinella septempunctata]|uniref:uncharacterized protein LOC123316650 n=1 Tax=Coccinella septempunctata TaxID=41139 RepID=UPI001D067221|nr:uncharacterized protein LOC123316650 [Coccinella septempunctata]
MRCFVPNCENTQGVPFPEDQELKNIWLKSLHIEDVLPDDGSFVCLDHFEKDDIEDIVNEENFLERRVLPTAIPKLSIESAGGGGESFQLSNQSLDSPQNDSESSNFYIPINEESSTQSGDITEVQQNSPNGDQDLQISNQDSNLNPENEEVEQNEIVGSVQNQEDMTTVPEGENLIDASQEINTSDILPDGSESIAEDVGADKQTPLAGFEEYQERLLEQEYMEKDDAEKRDIKHEEVSQSGDQFLTVESELHQSADSKDQEYVTEDGESVQIYSQGEAPVLTSANEQMFVAEGQTIFTTAGQHVYVTEGQTILTSEGQQVFVTEGQTVFTTNGQQVFVSDGQALIAQGGQTLITEDGQRVFLGEDEQSLNEHENFITSNDNFQNASEVESALVQGAEGEIRNEEAQVAQTAESNEDDLELLKQHVRGEVKDQTADVPKGNFMGTRQLVINEQLISDDYDATMDQNESMESENLTQNQEGVHPAATLVVKKEVDLDTPRNIVMEWFVPTTTNESSQPVTNFTGILSQTGNKQQTQPASQHRIPSGVPQRTPQRFPLKRNPDNYAASTSRKPTEGDILSEDTCRLCGLVESKYINILDNIKNNVMILEAIQLCIHPLEVSLEDPFSKKICIGCFNSLQKYYEFRQKCLEMNIEQRRQYEKAHPNYKFSDKTNPFYQYITDCLPKRTHTKTIITPSKTGYKQTEVLTVTKGKGNGAKNITRKIILTPTNYKKDEGKHVKKEPDGNVRKVISRTNKFDNIQVFKTGASSNHTGSKILSKTSSPKAAIPILSPKKFGVSQIEALARKPLSPEKQLKIQEELKKVIEGKMSKDELSMDQVIVRVVSDDESDDGKDYLPHKRRRVSLVNTSVTRTGHSKMRIGKSEVVIPKGIRVTIPDRFESSKGVFPCFKKLGAFDTEFSLIDGYLFEHRLCKGKERYLKCLSTSCPSKATQKLISNEIFENRAAVTVAHNHHPLTSTEIKKQMFYYIMKKKMQADRGMNFRNIYDQICQKDPEIAVLVPLRSLINEICKHQLTQKVPPVNSFDDFYNIIEDDALQKFQFTFSGKQFYQERFTVEEEGTKAVVFANVDTIKKVSNSKLMYVDASFRIDTCENFNYQLVTVLVWIDDSYYPIMFALVSNRTMEIFKKIFGYLHDTLAPNLCPEEIVTDYEANIYYALGETYLDSHIGGSVFYYTQNLYKKICELGLSKELETTSYFRNIYHMLLMLPLLPVNTIMDGLHNIEIQANDLGIGTTVAGLIEHIQEQWMDKVTPDLFCVHRLENRINENVIAPFKKLRDFLMLNKGKAQRQSLTLVNVVEKLIELENFLQTTYSSENKKSFGRDLSSSQKKNVLKAWHYIESHPKININHFFTKVIGYIKCMENQLWIWGYYKFSGKVTDDLINAANFSIVNTNETEMMVAEDQEAVLAVESNSGFAEGSDNTLVMEAMVGPSGEFVLSNSDTNQESDSSLFKYVYKSET